MSSIPERIPDKSWKRAYVGNFIATFGWSINIDAFFDEALLALFGLLFAWFGCFFLCETIRGMTVLYNTLAAYTS